MPTLSKRRRLRQCFRRSCLYVDRYGLVPFFLTAAISSAYAVAPIMRIASCDRAAMQMWPPGKSAYFGILRCSSVRLQRVSSEGRGEKLAVIMNFRAAQDRLRRATVTCRRCINGKPARFQVRTDLIDMLVCEGCAEEAGELGLPVANPGS